MKLVDRRHLRDDRMIAMCLGADLRPSHRQHALAHLRECLMCTRRYEAIGERITGLREDADAELDEVFSPAALETQRAQIMARIEHAGQHARVIQFPRRSSQPMSIFTGTQLRRWTAAAAAAGLIIGLTVGRITDFPASSAPSSRGQAAAQSTGRPTYRPAVEQPRTPTDEDVLSNMDRPLYLQPVQELEALDAMTPHPQPIAMRLR